MATSTQTPTSIASLMGNFQNEMNKLQEAWSSKVDDSIVYERQALEKQRESLQAKEEELRNWEAKLKEDDGKLKRRVDSFDAFVLEEEERIEKLRAEYEKKLELVELDLDPNEDLLNTVVSQKVEMCNLKNNVDSLGKFQEDLQKENDELRKKLASKKEKEAEVLQWELRLKKREEELANREEELEKKEKNIRDEKKLRKMEEDVKREGVQVNVKEDVDNAGPPVPVWQPAVEYVTSLENGMSSDDDPIDQSRMESAIKILNVAAGKGKGKNCELAFSCSTRMIHEAKLAYRSEPDFEMIEVLAIGKGDSPVDAVWSACKSVQKMILDDCVDSGSDTDSQLSSSSSSSSFSD